MHGTAGNTYKQTNRSNDRINHSTRETWQQAAPKYCMEAERKEKDYGKGKWRESMRGEGRDVEPSRPVKIEGVGMAEPVEGAGEGM